LTAFKHRRSMALHVRVARKINLFYGLKIWRNSLLKMFGRFPIGAQDMGNKIYTKDSKRYVVLTYNYRHAIQFLGISE
jgi:hypothetical protein